MKLSENKVYTLRVYLSEFSIRVIEDRIVATEYREVKSFRGYRTKKIKSVVITREQFDLLRQRAIDYVKP